MSETWNALSPAARDLIRRGAEQALNPRPEGLAELYEAVLESESTRDIFTDPVLAEGARQANLSNLLHWAAANFQDPGARVSPNLSREMLESSRDFVRRDLDETVLETWRLGQNVAWRRWMEICFELSTDIDVLHEALAVSSHSISAFIDATIAAVADVMRRERSELTQGTHAERLTTVSLLLEGAPVSRSAAEAKLAYPLTGSHLAAIIWGGAGTSGDRLEQAAELLLRHSKATRRLTVVATSSTLWLWLPTAVAPAPDLLSPGLTAIGDVHVALGRPRPDVHGFRQSHLEAATVQRMMARLGTPHGVGSYADTQMVALLSDDVGQADAFITDTLGRLATAEPELRVTLRTYLAEQCNAARVAERLYTHRNTIVRRLSRCDELLPRPLSANPTSVGAALELLWWRGTPLDPHQA